MPSRRLRFARPARRFKKRWLALGLTAWCIGVGVWQTHKPLPEGVDISSETVAVAPESVQFLYDLTYRDAQDASIKDQRIFDEILRLIDESHSFIVADFFLVNDLMGATHAVHRRLSHELVERLIERKRAKPQLQILFITDPINDVYGGADAPLLDALRDAGIDVVVTDLRPLRDSNAGYSAVWRTGIQWWGNSTRGGWLPNPFASDAHPITLRSWLSLLNFKANHRKLIVTDRADGTLLGLVTSANPHDASSAHSNVALGFEGPLAQKMAASELAIARFSGWTGTITHLSRTFDAPQAAEDAPRLTFLTEQAIRAHLLAQIERTGAEDVIDIATFYLSDRLIVEALLAAAQRGTRVRLILDANRDAFGLEKDGVPNRPVAHELVTKSDGKIEVRWYRTHGEQFHTKLALIRSADRLVASLGSANLTRRNVGNLNLEANIAIDIAADSELATEMRRYFERLWTNDGGQGRFTDDFAAYADPSRLRYWRYRVMEATGLSTF
jgi:phosphatidylserine/phosphatidylglycerophosphate/cardiolipin synthase-like enzyme